MNTTTTIWEAISFLVLAMVNLKKWEAIVAVSTGDELHYYTEEVWYAQDSVEYWRAEVDYHSALAS